AHRAARDQHQHLTARKLRPRAGRDRRHRVGSDSGAYGRGHERIRRVRNRLLLPTVDLLPALDVGLLRHALAPGKPLPLATRHRLAVDTWSLAVVAAALLVYAGVSRRLESSVVSSAMLFLTVGLLTGGEVLGWFDLEIGSGAVRALAEVTLTLVLFADASRIDLRTLRKELALPARLLGLGLPLTIVAGALAAWLVFGQLIWAEALVLAIVLAPTDAALGQAVVTDPR